MMEHIFDDEREITRLMFEHNTSIRIGQLGVTKIEPYMESYSERPVLWFALWEGDVLVARVNSGFVLSVEYKE